MFLLMLFVEWFIRTVLIANCNCFGIKLRSDPNMKSYIKAYGSGEHLESYHVSRQPMFKNAFGPGLLAVEPLMSKKILEQAKREFRLEDQKAQAMALYEDELGQFSDESDEEMQYKRQQRQKLMQIKKPRQWSPLEVGSWVENLGNELVPYMYVFIVNQVNGQILMDIDEEYLEEKLEMEIPKHRQRLLKGLAKLKVLAGEVKTKAEREAEQVEKEKKKQSEAYRAYLQTRPHFERWTKYALGFQFKLYNPQATAAQVKEAVMDEWTQLQLLDQENVF